MKGRKSDALFRDNNLRRQHHARRREAVLYFENIFIGEAFSKLKI